MAMVQKPNTNQTTETNIVENWQRALGKQHERIMTSYYEITDDLYWKLKDLAQSTHLPSLELAELNCILQWEQGLISSSQVLNAMEQMGDLKKMAETRLTRKLQKFVERTDLKQSTAVDYASFALEKIRKE
jgi:hypothetical protein